MQDSSKQEGQTAVELHFLVCVDHHNHDCHFACHTSIDLQMLSVARAVVKANAQLSLLFLSLFKHFEMSHLVRVKQFSSNALYSSIFWKFLLRWDQLTLGLTNLWKMVARAFLSKTVSLTGCRRLSVDVVAWPVVGLLRCRQCHSSSLTHSLQCSVYSTGLHTRLGQLQLLGSFSSDINCASQQTSSQWA